MAGNGAGAAHVATLILLSLTTATSRSRSLRTLCGLNGFNSAFDNLDDISLVIALRRARL
jgi:hypothetical protein